MQGFAGDGPWLQSATVNFKILSSIITALTSASSTNLGGAFKAFEKECMSAWRPAFLEQRSIFLRFFDRLLCVSRVATTCVHAVRCVETNYLCYLS